MLNKTRLHQHICGIRVVMPAHKAPKTDLSRAKSGILIGSFKMVRAL